MRSPEDDEVILTIGRELSHALKGNVKIKVKNKELLLDERTETRLYLFTNGELNAQVMSALGERGYELLYVPDDLLGELDERQNSSGSVWQIIIPDTVYELFDEYVTVRGEAHPAPPKKRPEPIRYDGHVIHRSKWDAMESLPHPIVDGLDAFDAKIQEIREE